VLVIHGIGTRDKENYLAEIAGMNAALGDRVRLIPVYWGDMGAPTQPLDTILPYLAWSDREVRVPRERSAEVRSALAGRDLNHVLDTVASGWRRRSAESRRRLIAAIYGLVRSQYQWASGEFTGDLIVYQRHQGAIHSRIWQAVHSHAPGHGVADRPIDVISHSLGGAMVFDLAVGGDPALHVRSLLTCASPISYFHIIGCSPTGLDPMSTGRPVTVPPSIEAWTNFFVPLDPWAFLAAPVFTLNNGRPPEDVEVYAGERGDRVLAHAASYYWTHPVFLDRARERLGASGTSG